MNSIDRRLCELYRREMDITAIPSHFFNRVNLRTVVELATVALRERQGFSLVRIGDGEGPILSWPQFQRPDLTERIMEVWFGAAKLTASDFERFNEGLRRAVLSADVLGLPTKFQVARAPGYGMVFDGIDYYGLHRASQPFADSGVHWYLQWSGAIPYLLRDLDIVHVIGCRDIGPQIADALGLRSVRMYLVRGESRFPGAVTQPHWPDGYTEIMGQLEAIDPGSVFLVGAGMLGKIYCDRIKAKGGIALDIGSILDSWAHVPSRERYGLGSPAFTLEHFKTTGSDWETMTMSLRRCAAELHARDSTLTL
jgi:hypothetical protein